MTNQERPAQERGFTLIEMLVVLAIMSIAAMISIPYLSAQIQRSKLLGVASQVSGLMRLARLDAIKYSRSAMVAVDPSGQKINAFSDRNSNDRPDAGEEIGEVILPKSVTLAEPAGQTAECQDGFTTKASYPRFAWFKNNGAIERLGAFCFKSEAMGTAAPNYLEVKVAPEATARIALLKYESGAWVENDGTGAWKWN